jgi:hypothetical protein
LSGEKTRNFKNWIVRAGLPFLRSQDQHPKAQSQGDPKCAIRG